MTARMFTHSTPRKWSQPGLDSLGPTSSDLRRQKQREALAQAKAGTSGQKRKSYYEKQLEKFGFR